MPEWPWTQGETNSRHMHLESLLLFFTIDDANFAHRLEGLDKVSDSVGG